MVNAQKWLDENYLKEKKENITILLVNNKELEGNLDLKGFTNLEELKCNSNKLDGIDLNECHNLKWLDCSNNKLTSLNLRNNSSLEVVECFFNELKEINLPTKPHKLTKLDLTDNNFPKQGLSFLKNYVNLEEVSLWNYDIKRMEENRSKDEEERIYNRFYGFESSKKHEQIEGVKN